MLPPGNHAYAAFAPDAPWEITYDGIFYFDQVLNPSACSSTCRCIIIAIASSMRGSSYWVSPTTSTTHRHADLLDGVALHDCEHGRATVKSKC